MENFKSDFNWSFANKKRVVKNAAENVMENEKSITKEKLTIFIYPANTLVR